jgi:hypothetical protein
VNYTLLLSALFILNSLTFFAQNTSLEGNYLGNLPCPNCQIIKTHIQIGQNNSYKITCDYQNIDAGYVLDQSGSLIFNPNQTIITLKLGKQRMYFLIGKNKLTQLNDALQPFEDAGENNYTLTKENYQLVNTKWEFVAIGNYKLDNYDHTNYLIFDNIKDVYHAELSCDIYESYFSIEADNAIYMREANKMLQECDELVNKNFSLRETLKNTKSFSIINDELTLYDADKKILAQLRNKD